MTCQACQTWNGDDEHRCRRCGRRLRATPTRHVRSAYPIAATALAYQPEATVDATPAPQVSPTADSGEQPMLFAQLVNDNRVIPFDQLTSAAERESIRARAAKLSQPAPVKTSKQEVSARRRRKSGRSEDQQQFDFFGKADITSPLPSAIQCGAPVAPPFVRLSAALVDGFMITAGAVVVLSVFRFATGSLPIDKVALSAYLAAVAALAIAYKLIWCFANRDSFGMMSTRLRVVDFDGNPPARKRRFWRALSSLLSVGGAGLGLIWTFADADSLTWHDQISGTFPTFEE